MPEIKPAQETRRIRLSAARFDTIYRQSEMRNFIESKRKIVGKIEEFGKNTTARITGALPRFFVEGVRTI